MRYQDRYDSLIKFYAQKYRLDWEIIKKQMLAESSANPKAVSCQGAKGLMQFIDSAWQDFGNGDIFNPEDNIKAGCKYMNYLKDKFMEIPRVKERYKFALASYNAGRGNINLMLQQAREDNGGPALYSNWVKAGQPEGRWQSWEVAKEYLEEVTGRDNALETVNYVARIMS